MDSSLCTLSKLFTEKLFRIPDYQRGYSWTKRQLRDFWTDLEQLAKDQRHYTGVLTLQTVQPDTWKRWDDDSWIIQGKSYSPYYVVDGQQRLTTIIILLQCILEKTKADTKLNFSSKNEIQQKFIFVPKDLHHGSYVFGYEKDNPSYQCLKTQILGKTSAKYSADENTIYTKNLTLAKSFFSEQISSLIDVKLEELYKKLTQQLLFNVFYIDEEVDVHVAFETMNNRGLLLSNLELLKNRLIYLSTKIGEPKSNIASTRKTINDCWKVVYYYLGKNPKASLSDDNFLFIHFILHFGKKVLDEHPKIFENSFHAVMQRDFYKDYLLQEQFNVKRIYSIKADQRLTSTDLLSYSLDLKKTAESYYTICFPEDSKYSDSIKVSLERLKRLRAASNSKELMVVLLLFFPQMPDDKKQFFLESIEQYFFISNLLPYAFRRKNKPAKIAEEIVKLSSKKTGGEDFFKIVKDELISWPAISGFKEALLTGLGESSYYGWADIQYFLFEYEIHLKNKAKRKTDKIDWDSFTSSNYDEDHESIEHILPQTASEPYWKSSLTGLKPKQQKLLTNSLGNLLAISSPRNSSLRNRPFPEKVSGKDSFTGYRFGSYSENEVATSQDWGPEQILLRGLRMLDFLENRWAVDLGTREEKIKLLGIEFVQLK